MSLALNSNPLRSSLMLVLCLLADTALADTGRGHIPLRTNAATQILRSFDQHIADQSWDQAFSLLKKHHAELWHEQPLHLLEERLGPCPHQLNASLCRTLVLRLRQLPADAQQLYCAQFDQAAQSLLDLSLTQRDLDGLERCFMLYPITAAGQRAALLLGEMLLEQGSTDKARALWTLATSTDPEMRADSTTIASRRALLTESGDASDTARIVPYNETSLPAAPFTRGHLKWKATLAGTPQDMGLRILPRFHEESMLITSGTRLTVLERENGMTHETVRLPRAQGFDDFSENSTPRIHQPLLGQGRLVTSYVRVVNEPERFAGYSIKVAIPQRSLRGIPLDTAPLWDTASEESTDDDFSGNSRPHDLSLRGLSLNGPLLRRGDDIYTLAWSEAGYIDVYLLCLDFNNGQCRWKTLLTSNQLELTVFGELAREPLMGAIGYDNGSLYVCTNLGVVAAVEPDAGRVRWLTEYPQRQRQQEPTYYYPDRRRPYWDCNPVVFSEGRVIVTPIDATQAFAFDKESGGIVDTGNRQTMLTTQLGVYNGKLVTHSMNVVRVTPIDDLGQVDREITLHQTPNGLPLLVSDGIVYSSNRGVHHRSLVDLEDVEAQIFTHAAPLPDDSQFYPCTLSIHQGCIYTTTAREVCCYIEVPPAPKPGVSD